MWNPVKNYPFGILVYVFNSLLGSLLLFIAAGALGYALTTLHPRDYSSASEYLALLPFAWLLLLIMSTIALVGVPFLLVHFWTLYRLFYTDDSRVNLFFIAFATHSAVCISVGWITDFSESWLRGLISIGVIAATYFTMKKFNLFHHDTSTHHGAI